MSGRLLPGFLEALIGLFSIHTSDISRGYFHKLSDYGDGAGFFFFFVKIIVYPFMIKYK